MVASIANRPGREAGFTLIEMMISLVVLAVLMTLAAPGFREFILEQRIKAASFDLFASLTLVRGEAIKRNTTVFLVPATGGWTNGWCVALTSDATCTATTTDTNVVRYQGIKSNLTLTTTPSSLGSVSFNRAGRPSAAFTFLITNTPGLTTVSGRCVGIDLSGRPYTKVGSTC